MNRPDVAPVRDPLDVPADILRQRIRLALSVLAHRDHPTSLVAQILRGEAGLE